MKTQRGFTLIELMIAMTIGLVICVSVMQIFVSTSVTQKVNNAVSQLQDSGRVVTLSLQKDLALAGLYNNITMTVNNDADAQIEASFIQNNPVSLPGDYSAQPALGSIQSTTNDTLVINLMATSDCAGSSHGYPLGSFFHVINQYYVSAGELRCRGYDGRIASGLKSSVATASEKIIMDDVASFQVEFGISGNVNSGSTVIQKYVTADGLETARNQNRQVLSVRLAILMETEAGAIGQSRSKVKILNEPPLLLDERKYYQVFNQEVLFRNSKYAIGSSVL